jgi:hypothetical protein
VRVEGWDQGEILTSHRQPLLAPTDPYLLEGLQAVGDERRAHDRETFDLTDGQVVERLRVAANKQGINVKELLRKLAQE